MSLLLAIVAIGWIIVLSQRVSRLEEKVEKRSLGEQHVSVRGPVESGAAPSIVSAVPPTPSYANVASAPAPDTNNQFIEWVQKDFLMKIGALFLLMALGWFVSYAFMNNWIGPAGRITLGLLAGAFFMVLGVWRIRTREHQGAVFTVLGSTTVLLTVYAAREIYDFFTPLSALVIMFLSVVFVAFVSLRYKRQSLALAGLVLACIAPYFTSSPTLFVIEQFLYLLTIVVGTLWIVLYTGWRNLTALALTLVAFETLPYFGTDERFLVLLIVFVFVAIFFLANIASILRVAGEKLSQAHLFTAFGTAAFLMIWVFTVAPKESQSLLFSAWMIVFSMGAFAVYKATENRIPFYIYGGSSLALLAGATAAELEGPLLTIAFTFEVAVVVAVASIARLEHSATALICWLFALPVVLSFESFISREWQTGVMHGDFFVLLILTLVLSIVGIFLTERSRDEKENMNGAALIVLGGLYGLALLWLVLHALLEYDFATMVTYVIYTLLGLYMFFGGRASLRKALTVSGGMLLGFVVGRLLLIDVWSMELVGRIVTFIVIGVLLLSTAFIGRNAKHPQLP